jgi:hypothetical protein
VILGSGDGEKKEVQALGKVLSDKPVHAEGMAASLGRAWCPLKGVRCKAMGGNVFMFTFLQESGKKRALCDGPWKANNDLIVMADFDPGKAMDEHIFDTIPIWIRVFKLPLGWMNRDMGMEIGDMVGEGVDVDVGEDGSAVGEYLRVKARINITKPLMRGFLRPGKDTDSQIWCPFEYEFLPEFCYMCGIIGHDYDGCSITLAKGEKRQYGGWLRAFIKKKHTR